jgi:hypothetical protein
LISVLDLVKTKLSDENGVWCYYDEKAHAFYSNYYY